MSVRHHRAPGAHARAVALAFAGVLALASCSRAPDTAAPVAPVESVDAADATDAPPGAPASPGDPDAAFPEFAAMETRCQTDETGFRHDLVANTLEALHRMAADGVTTDRYPCFGRALADALMIKATAP